VDPDTGDRVVRLSGEAGSESLCLHQNAYTPDGAKLLGAQVRRGLEQGMAGGFMHRQRRRSRDVRSIAGPGFRSLEIEHVHRSCSRDLDVGWLQIAMDGCRLVRGFECIGELACDIDLSAEVLSRARSLGDADDPAATPVC